MGLSRSSSRGFERQGPEAQVRLQPAITAEEDREAKKEEPLDCYH